jgi:hypothetical protein
VEPLTVLTALVALTALLVALAAHSRLDTHNARLDHFRRDLNAAWYQLDGFRGEGEKVEPKPAPTTRRARHPRLKIGDVLTIRRLYREGNTTAVQLGRQYGITKNHVYRIVGYRAWKHVR